MLLRLNVNKGKDIISQPKKAELKLILLSNDSVILTDRLLACKKYSESITPANRKLERQQRQRYYFSAKKVRIKVDFAGK